MTPPLRTSVEGNESIARLLAADHGDIDASFREAEAAMALNLPGQAHTALDGIWMRLAVHIRAEHKVVFLALEGTRPDLRGTLGALREDHDFFMASLATAVKAVQALSPDVASARVMMEAVRTRLAYHNTLEETRIYPVADHLPSEEWVSVLGAMTRELAFLPHRYGK